MGSPTNPPTNQTDKQNKAKQAKTKTGQTKQTNTHAWHAGTNDERAGTAAQSIGDSSAPFVSPVAGTRCTPESCSPLSLKVLRLPHNPAPNTSSCWAWQGGGNHVRSSLRGEDSSVRSLLHGRVAVSCLREGLRRFAHPCVRAAASLSSACAERLGRQRHSFKRGIGWTAQKWNVCFPCFGRVLTRRVSAPSCRIASPLRQWNRQCQIASTQCSRWSLEPASPPQSFHEDLSGKQGLQPLPGREHVACVPAACRAVR